MADVKRNSTAAKVATPKTGGQSMPDTIEALSTALGARVKLTTTAPHAQTLEGVLFTACPILHVIAINTTPAPPNPSSTLSSQPGNYHIVPIRHIQSFEVLTLAPNENGKGWSGAEPKLGPVDTKKLKEREDAKIRKMHEQDRKRGKGVSREGQALYDAFDRMFQTRWHGPEIIVMDAVIIAPPYTVDDCRAPKDKATSLAHIKRVLEGERKKLASRTATPPVGPRKGG